jgi:hypothetical protein
MGNRYAKMRKQEERLIAEVNGERFMFEAFPVEHDTKRGITVGSRDDYMMELNATLNDLEKALKQVVQSQEFTTILQHHADFISSSRKLRHGVLIFKLKDGVPNPKRLSRRIYSISATGQLRGHVTMDMATKESISRLKSPPPSRDQPTPYENMAKTYSNALTELYRRFTAV